MIFSLLSAGLLYLSFPNICAFRGFPFLVWIFAVPFFYSLEGKGIRRRAGLGLFWGLAAYGLIANWFVAYSWPGFLFFIFLLSVQSVFFALLFFPSKKNILGQACYVAACWVVSESLRVALMRGLSWDVGHALAFQNRLVQIADIIGSAGLSFVIIFVNYCFYQLWRGRDRQLLSAGLIAVIFMLLVSYGIFASRRNVATGADVTFDACLVQPNIDFREKLDPENVPLILEKNLRLTEQCFAAGKPDVILWPETAVPLDIRAEPELLARVQSVAAPAQVPLIFGSVIEEGEKIYNGILWLAAGGHIREAYRKRALVPLSEYMPSGFLGKVLSATGMISNYDFSPGRGPAIQSQVLRYPLRMGFLICSEDTMAKFFQQYVRNGADLVLVFLNDGWFHDKAGLAIHAQQAVMHAVENRITVVRVSNNGLSGVIDSRGRIHSGHLKFYQEGVWRAEIVAGVGQKRPPFFGQILCALCWAFVIIIIVFSTLFKKRKGTMFSLKGLLVTIVVILCYSTSAYGGGAAARGPQQQKARMQQQMKAQQQAIIEQRIAQQAAAKAAAEAAMVAQYQAQKAAGQVAVHHQVSVQQQISQQAAAEAVAAGRRQLEAEKAAQVAEVVTFDQVLESLDNSSEAWPLMIDEEAKWAVLNEYIGRYRQDGVVIRKPATYYAGMIDSMSAQAPEMLANPFSRVLETVAIIEYDFDNGKNKDVLARKVLGSDQAVAANKKRLGIR